MLTFIEARYNHVFELEHEDFLKAFQQQNYSSLNYLASVINLYVHKCIICKKLLFLKFISELAGYLCR